MPTYPSSVGGNSRYLQQQILRAGTARMGPVSIEPGDGHIRLNDGTNDTGRLDFNGIQLRYRGAMRGLTALTEGFATLMESHTRTLETNIGRLNGHDADVVRIDAKNTAQDQSLALKAWTSYVDQQDGAASTRMDGIDGTLANKAWTSYVDSQNSSQNTRMNGMDSATAAAQSRANAAYGLAEGRATQAQISSLSRQINTGNASSRDRDEALGNRIDAADDWITTLKARVKSLEDWRASLPGA